MNALMRIIMVSCIGLSILVHAKRTEQPVAGRVTLRNGTREDIEVYFYATRAKKRRRPVCRSTVRTIPALESTTVYFEDCSINVIEVHHVPEEEFEQTTKEFLSLEDQETETFFEYQGPNRIVQIKFKTRS